MRLLARTPVGKHSHSYVSTPVTSTAWVEIIASLSFPCDAVEIFSAAGATIKLSLGAAGDEDNHEIPYYVLPGGSSILLPLKISRGQRISARSIDLDADAGSLVLNFFA